jgi:ABC-type phosphate/phosphonate transport system ATPase subunit
MMTGHGPNRRRHRHAHRRGGQPCLGIQNYFNMLRGNFAVDNVSLKIAQRTFVSLLGPSAVGTVVLLAPLSFMLMAQGLLRTRRAAAKPAAAAAR